MKLLLRGERTGWFDFTAELAAADGRWTRPAGAEATRNGDTMLIYFSSGTTGMPKMVRARFHLSAGPHRDGEVLAERARGRPAL